MYSMLFLILVTLGYFEVVTNTAIDVSPKNAEVYFNEFEQCELKICSDVSYYPEEEIRKIIENKTILSNHFNSQLLYTVDSYTQEGRDLNGKGDTEFLASELCKSESTNVYTPLAMLNSKNEWKYIVNIDTEKQSYTQSFQSIICSKTGNDHPEGGVERNQEVECVQEHQDLLLLTYDNGIVEFDKFTVPTICNSYPKE